MHQLNNMLLLAVLCALIPLCDGFSPTALYNKRSGSCTASHTLLFDNKSSDIQNKMKAQMEKLQERDRTSSPISSDVSVYFCTSVVGG
jgi:hypothetical protein